MYVVVNLITDLPYFYIDAAFEKPDSKDHEALPDATGINRDVLSNLACHTLNSDKEITHFKGIKHRRVTFKDDDKLVTQNLFLSNMQPCYYVINE
jgi:hypothetical protein